MRWIRAVLVHLGCLGGSKILRQEIDEELQFHLERRVEVNIAEGMTLDEARDDAIRRLGEALVHGSGFGYLMRTKRPLPEVSTDEVSEAQPVQVREVSISGAELG